MIDEGLWIKDCKRRKREIPLGFRFNWATEIRVYEIEASKGLPG